MAYMCRGLNNLPSIDVFFLPLDQLRKQLYLLIENQSADEAIDIIMDLYNCTYVLVTCLLMLWSICLLDVKLYINKIHELIRF